MTAQHPFLGGERHVINRLEVVQFWYKRLGVVLRARAGPARLPPRASIAPGTLIPDTGVEDLRRKINVSER